MSSGWKKYPGPQDHHEDAEDKCGYEHYERGVQAERCSRARHDSDASSVRLTNASSTFGHLGLKRRLVSRVSRVLALMQTKFLQDGGRTGPFLPIDVGHANR